MFPDWNQARRRFTTGLDRLAAQWDFRIAVAVMLVCFHIVSFAKAGRDRLDLPFNSQTGHAPYYSDPDAPATRGFPRQPHYWSRLIVSRWDSQHYIGSAIRGVTACPQDSSASDLAYLDCGMGWLPAWGMAAGTLSEVTGLPEDVALVSLSMLAAFIINLLWTSRAIVGRLGKLEAYGALIAFNVFPSAFYVVTPYTEAASIALALAGFVALSKDRWVLAGILVGAATSLGIRTIPFPFALGCAALIAAWSRRRDHQPQWWRPLLAIALCGWGQLVEMIWLQLSINNAFAFWRARAAFGDDHSASRLWDPEWYLKGFSSQHMDMVIVVAVVAIMVLTTREVLRRFKPEQATFLIAATAVNLVLGIIAPIHYWGLTRYLLFSPLAFVGMGILLRKHAVLFFLWIALSLLFYWHVELCSYVSQGDPRICPCLGTLEYWFPFRS